MNLKNLSTVMLAIALVVVAGASATGLGTQAAFTDTATANATFTSGNVDLDLASALDCTAAVYADTLALGAIASNMKPGDTQITTVCVKNNGSLTYQWSMSTTSTDDTSTLSALEAVTRIRVHKHSDNTTACVARLDAAAADVALGVGEVALMTSRFMDVAMTIASSADTSLASAAVMKVCISTALGSGVVNSDPDAVATIQNKIITAAFNFSSSS